MSARQADITMKWIATLLLVTPAILAAETTLEFHLCSAYVQQSASGERSGRGWPVFVKLTEEGARNFKKFTEANLGRMSRVVVGDREFSRARIRAPIPDGNLYAAFGSEEAAMAWQRVLASKLPVDPCGAGSMEMPKSLLMEFPLNQG